MAKKWIQSAIKHPGAFTKKAKSAGMSVSYYAKKMKGKGGTTGKQARLAITLGKLRKKNPSEPYGSGGCFQARGKIGVG